MQSYLKYRGRSATSIFYPRHIEKKHKRFFLQALCQFSKEENEAMFEEGEEFERSMPHEEYEEMVERLEK